jgi:GNAT superfamily N-acetyltransferase
MSLPEGFTVRRADVTDIDMLVAQRHAMFRDVHHSEEALLNSMSANFRAWALQHMNAGDYLAWLAEARDGTIAAGAALWMMDWPPHVIGKSSRRGNIVNVYTRDKFRRLGLARQMMETVLAWCRENGVDIVILHASPFGRGLYESMGFKPTNEMRLQL